MDNNEASAIIRTVLIEKKGYTDADINLIEIIAIYDRLGDTLIEYKAHFNAGFHKYIQTTITIDNRDTELPNHDDPSYVR